MDKSLIVDLAHDSHYLERAMRNKVNKEYVFKEILRYIG